MSAKKTRLPRLDNSKHYTIRLDSAALDAMVQEAALGPNVSEALRFAIQYTLDGLRRQHGLPQPAQDS